MDQPRLHRCSLRRPPNMCVFFWAAFRPEITQFILLLRHIFLPPLLPQGHPVPPVSPPGPLSPRSSRRGRVFIHVGAVASCGFSPFESPHVTCSYHASNSFAFQMFDFGAMYFPLLALLRLRPHETKKQPFNPVHTASRYFLLLLLIRINYLRVQPSAPPARNAHVTSASRQLALQCAGLTSVTALLDFWHFPIQLIVLALIFAVGFTFCTSHVT